MPIGAFTGNFDLPLLLVIVFVLFFGALVFYLRQEDKREGYPLVSGRTDASGGRVPVVGFPPLPTPKTFHRPQGRGSVTVPRPDDRSPVPPLANPGSRNGMPVDTGVSRMGESLGPGSWVERDDLPDQNVEGEPVYRPLRQATEFHVMKGECDPRGFDVLGCDKVVAGTVVDVWVDTSEHFAKFIEVRLAPGLDCGIAPYVPERAPATGEPDDRSPGADSVLLPIEFAALNSTKKTVRTAAITGAQFAGVPRRRRDLVITAREENRLRGYFGGGLLWAVPSRAEPLI